MSRQIVGILLAAGAGTRFGSDKLLHRLADGRPLAVASAAHLLAACPRVLAVVRPDHEPLAWQLAEAGCQIVSCSQADQGMGHSLAAGVQAAADADGWLVALADMPFIAASSHQSVLAALHAGASLAAPHYAGQRGHPVGFAREWFPQLAALTGDHGAKSILESDRQKLLLIPVADRGVIRDVDRPEQLVQGPEP